MRGVSRRADLAQQPWQEEKPRARHRLSEGDELAAHCARAKPENYRQQRSWHSVSETLDAHRDPAHVALESGRCAPLAFDSRTVAGYSAPGWKQPT